MAALIPMRGNELAGARCLFQAQWSTGHRRMSDEIEILNLWLNSTGRLPLNWSRIASPPFRVLGWSERLTHASDFALHPRVARRELQVGPNCDWKPWWSTLIEK